MPFTPGDRQQVLLERALGYFEMGRGRLGPLERAAFAQGWLAGDNGRELVAVVAELDPAHPDFARVLPLLAIGHYGGYCSFLRELPDYDQGVAALKETLAAVRDELNQPAPAVATPAQSPALSSAGTRRGVLEALAAWLERRF
jgi:hypothetical protein